MSNDEPLGYTQYNYSNINSDYESVTSSEIKSDSDSDSESSSESDYDSDSESDSEDETIKHVIRPASKKPQYKHILKEEFDFIK